MYTIDCGTSFRKVGWVKSERGSYLEEIASLVDMKDIESTDMPLKAGIVRTNL